MYIMAYLAIWYSYKEHNPYSLQKVLSFLILIYELTQLILILRYGVREFVNLNSIFSFI